MTKTKDLRCWLAFVCCIGALSMALYPNTAWGVILDDENPMGMVMTFSGLLQSTGSPSS